MLKSTRSNILLRSASCILTFAFLPVLSSCEQIGSVGGLLARNIPKHVDAAYKGLVGQTVIVMVWMDRAMRADHPDLQLDVAAGLQDKLISVARDDKPDALKKTVFPVLCNTVIQYQEDHPEINFEPITTTAAKFDGTRLIYLEIKEFDTHAGSPDLYRGTMKGDLKAIEMKDGKAKVAFHEEDISVLYPKDSPNDGLPIGTDSKITEGTVSAFIDEVSKRFYAHDEDRN